MSKKNTVDLKLIKRLVVELENHLNTAEGIRTSNDFDSVEYFTEMSRAMGVVSGVAQEAACLIGDIQLTIKDNMHPKEDLLSILKSPFKKEIKDN